MAKAKVKQNFQHKGKDYKPGDEFEGEDHEIQELTQQGHLEHAEPHGQQQAGRTAGAQPPKPPGR